MKASVLLVALVAAIGCASGPRSPGSMRSSSLVARPLAAAHGASRASDDTTKSAPVIQLRHFRGSSTVTILGWMESDAGYGLRSEVRRDGMLVGANDGSSHRLYLSNEFVFGMGGFSHAVIGPVPPGPVLRRAGAPRDVEACNRTLRCAPMVTQSLVVPDTILRVNRDSLVVSFVSPTGNDWAITLPRELIAGYLRAVDSVSTAMRSAR